jgi:hypothetical protein
LRGVSNEIPNFAGAKFGPPPRSKWRGPSYF